MIDYDKLKLAHELSEKLSTIDQYPIYISVRVFHEFSMYRLQSRDIQGNDESHFEDIDDLINKLRELTQPKSKYKIGDAVWLLNDFGFPEQDYISEIDECSDEKYFVNGQWFEEVSLYPTKQALIEAQIEYWKNLKDITRAIRGDVCPKCTQPMAWYSGNVGDGLWRTTCQNKECDYVRDDSVKECQHVSDDLVIKMLPQKFCCVKCGEFYK